MDYVTTWKQWPDGVVNSYNTNSDMLMRCGNEISSMEGMSLSSISRSAHNYPLTRPAGVEMLWRLHVQPLSLYAMFGGRRLRDMGRIGGGHRGGLH